MTFRFIWELITRKFPHGCELEVVFDADSEQVVAANYVGNGYPATRKMVNRLQEDIQYELLGVPDKQHYLTGLSLGLPRELVECAANS